MNLWELGETIRQLKAGDADAITYLPDGSALIYGDVFEALLEAAENYHDRAQEEIE